MPDNFKMHEFYTNFTVAAQDTGKLLVVGMGCGGGCTVRGETAWKVQ